MNNEHNGFVNDLKFKNPLLSQFELAIGYLIFDHSATGEKLKFRDANEKLHSFKNILTSKIKWSQDSGHKRIYRPYVYRDGKLIDNGESLLYGYIGNHENIVILFPVENPTIDNVNPELNYDLTDLQALMEEAVIENNDSRYLLVKDDGKGDFTFYLEGKIPEEGDPGTGNINIIIDGTENNGNLHLQLNGKFAITQTQKEGDENKAIAQMLFDNTKDSEKVLIIDKHKNKLELKKDGLIIKTPKVSIGDDSENMLKILTESMTTIGKFIDAINAMSFTTTQGKTIGPPINKGSFDLVKQDAQKISDRVVKFMEIE